MRKILVVLLAIVGLMIILAIKNEQQILTLESKSYVITNDYITDTLFKENNNSTLYAYSSGIEELSKLYKNTENYYFKEDLVILVNKKYPIYTENNTTLLNIDNDAKVIDDKYETEDNHFGTLLINGELYNSDKTRTDNKTYLFFKTSTNLLINSLPITVTTLNDTYIIPTNSIINFTDKDIKYYSSEENIFKYNQITDVDSSTIININNENISYNELLLNLGKKRIIQQLEKPIVDFV